MPPWNSSLARNPGSRSSPSDSATDLGLGCPEMGLRVARRTLRHRRWRKLGPTCRERDEHFDAGQDPLGLRRTRRRQHGGIVTKRRNQAVAFRARASLWPNGSQASTPASFADATQGAGAAASSRDFRRPAECFGRLALGMVEVLPLTPATSGDEAKIHDRFCFLSPANREHLARRTSRGPKNRRGCHRKRVATSRGMQGSSP